MDPVSKAQHLDVANNKKTRMLGGITGKGFMPGKSGNPSGRPKKKPISEIYEELLDDPKAREEIKKRIFQTMKGKGMAGVLERREAADRIEGKVPQGVEVAGEINLTLSGRLEKARERKAKK